jgi:hypothetical protein
VGAVHIRQRGAAPEWRLEPVLGIAEVGGLSDAPSPVEFARIGRVIGDAEGWIYVAEQIPSTTSAASWWSTIVRPALHRDPGQGRYPARGGTSIAGTAGLMRRLHPHRRRECYPATSARPIL